MLVRAAEEITSSFVVTDLPTAQLKGEALKAALEVCVNRTKCMRDVRNIPNVREYSNVDGHFFEEVRIFKCLIALITGKIELVKKSR
jgi:hypothetical protein